MRGSHFSLTGKVAPVTGGGSDIGPGISRALVEAGEHVVISGRREEILKVFYNQRLFLLVLLRG